MISSNFASSGRYPLSKTMGKVIRIRPNIYVFACEYCRSEHRSIDSFLRHTEGHFQHESTNTERSQATTQIHSDCFSTAEVIEPQQNTNGHIPFNGYPTYQYTPPHMGQNSQSPTVDITASPTRDSDDYIEEVYEIIDLGYDLDGNKYPMAEKAPVVGTTNGNNMTQSPNNGTKPAKRDKKFKCLFCSKQYAGERSLRNHKDNQHTDILSKIITYKKSFKCSLCDIRFPRDKKRNAEQHLTTHFKRSATKKSPKE